MPSDDLPPDDLPPDDLPPDSSAPAQTYPVTASRMYPSAPLVGVAAVVFNAAGQALLVERGRPPAQGKWGLPGGLLDLGEAVRDGIEREVAEETGVEIELIGLVDVFEPIERDENGRIRYHFVVIDYWARHRRGTPHPQDDAADVAWVPLDRLPHLPMEEATRRVIRKAYAHWQASESVHQQQQPQQPDQSV